MYTINELFHGIFSRQRYVLGDTAMHKLAASNVFLFGLNGVGVEIGNWSYYFRFSSVFKFEQLCV